MPGKQRCQISFCAQPGHVDRWRGAAALSLCKIRQAGSDALEAGAGAARLCLAISSISCRARAADPGQPAAGPVLGSARATAEGGYPVHGSGRRRTSLGMLTGEAPGPRPTAFRKSRDKRLRKQMPGNVMGSHPGPMARSCPGSRITAMRSRGQSDERRCCARRPAETRAWSSEKQDQGDPVSQGAARQVRSPTGLRGRSRNGS